MIIYFTGTGSSRYIAQAVADRLGDELVSANPYIKEGKKGSFESAAPYVFVSPVYLATLPKIFRDFLRRSEFRGAREAYFVVTCAGYAGCMANAASELCREKDLNFKGGVKLDMPQNYIALFKMSDAEQQERCFREAEAKVDAICGIIRSGGMLDMPLNSRFEYGYTRLVEKLYSACFTKTKNFRATDACVGCGLCEKQCPTNAIELKNGRPVWVKKLCIHCMACINRCPKQAIEYGKGTVGKARYVCPPYEKEEK